MHHLFHWNVSRINTASHLILTHILNIGNRLSRSIRLRLITFWFVLFSVGDIPTSGRISRGRSRDDVSSINSSRIQPSTRTVSRSFSVLAPWKPRFYREGYDINYSQNQQGTLKRTEKPPVKQPPKKESSSFLFGKSKSASTKNLTSSKYDIRPSEERSVPNRSGTSTLSRRPNTSTNGRISSNGTSTLRKSDGKLRSTNESKENININHNIGTLSKSRNDLSSSRSRDYKKSLSSELLERDRDTPQKGMKRSSVERERLSRSISMPKDPNKSAGWFKITKKSKKTESTNRLH